MLLHSTGLHVKADGTPETIPEFLAKKAADLQTCKVAYWYGQDARPDPYNGVVVLSLTQPQ
jgi:hypothetical protein